MDRYVIREPRVGVDYPEGNQIVSFSATSSGNTFTVPQNMYYSYGGEGQGHMPQVSPGLVVTPAQTFPPNLYPHQGQIVSGIDPRYLAAYSDNNASLITTGYVEAQTAAVDEFGVNYLNRNFIGPERNDNKPFPQRTQNATIPAPYKCVMPIGKPERQNTFQQKTPEVQPKPTQIDLMKNEEQIKVKTRKEKLKELHVTGTRVFSGPVEKILKWNKSLQDMGVMVLYEVVDDFKNDTISAVCAQRNPSKNAEDLQETSEEDTTSSLPPPPPPSQRALRARSSRGTPRFHHGNCISIRSGEHSAKNLVVRDQSGPAMQVVYYEIDSVLPELTLPCTIRVVGRMLSGSSRLQAFSVRAATADDVTALPRRAAVAAHHVTELCDEYGA